MNKLAMGISLGIAGAAVGAYMMMPAKSKRKVRSGLEGTVEDIKDIAGGFKES
jgi:hypothetical protein